MRTVVVAAPSSGSGKTTVTIGLLEALKRRGLVVQPFKAGPDYIDPGFHSAVTGRPSYNLDTWMMGADGVRSTFRKMVRGADAAVIEGVMGLFDGKGGSGVSREKNDDGSTAHIAKVLKAPVLLVVSAEKAAQSVAALVKGFKEFDPEVRLKWVVFNKVGSPNHFRVLKDSVESSGLRVKVLGYIPRDAELSMPSRHLGLVTYGDIKKGEWRGFVAKAAKTVERYLDIDSFIGRDKGRGAPKEGSARKTGRGGREGGEDGVCIGVALDKAFCFYYEENLDILRSYGAKIVFFSPLAGERLPTGVRGLYIGGGYPELHGAGLAGNGPMRRAVKEAALSGMPVFAECGGLMYLSRAIINQDRKRYPMAGVFPFDVRMNSERRALGYREVIATEDSPFLSKGEALRGHEYHYSGITGPKAGVRRVFGIKGASGRVEPSDGYLIMNTLAGYTHIHFASNPSFVKMFLEKCRRK